MNTINQSARWAIEHRANGEKVWRTLGTAGTRDQAERWLLRFAANGTFRIRHPQPQR